MTPEQDFMNEVGIKSDEHEELDIAAKKAIRDGDFGTALAVRERQKQTLEAAIELLNNPNKPALPNSDYVSDTLKMFKNSLEEISKEIPQLEQRRSFGAPSIPSQFSQPEMFAEEVLSPTRSSTPTIAVTDRSIDDIVEDAYEEELEDQTIERKPVMATKQELIDQIGKFEVQFKLSQRNSNADQDDVEVAKTLREQKESLTKQKELISQYKSEHGEGVEPSEKFNTQASEKLEKDIKEFDKRLFQIYEAEVSGWEADKAESNREEYIDALQKQKEWCEYFLDTAVDRESEQVKAVETELKRIAPALDVIEKISKTERQNGKPERSDDADLYDDWQDHKEELNDHLRAANDYLLNNTAHEDSIENNLISHLATSIIQDIDVLTANINSHDGVLIEPPQESVRPLFSRDLDEFDRSPGFDDDPDLKPSLSRRTSISTTPSQVADRLYFNELPPLTYGDRSVTPRQYLTNSETKIKKGGNTERAMNNANAQQRDLRRRLKSAISKAEFVKDDPVALEKAQASVDYFMRRINEHHDEMTKTMEQRNSITNSPGFIERKKEEAGIYLDRKGSNLSSRIESIKLNNPNATRRTAKVVNGTVGVAKAVRDVALFTPKYAFSSRKREKVNNKVSAWHNNKKQKSMTYKVSTRIGKWGGIGTASPIILLYMMARTKGRAQLAGAIKDGYSATKEAGREYLYKPIKGTLKTVFKRGPSYQLVKQGSRIERGLKQLFRKQPRNVLNKTKNLLGRKVGLSLRESLALKTAELRKAAKVGKKFVFEGKDAAEQVRNADSKLNRFIADTKQKQFEKSKEIVGELLNKKDAKLVANYQIAKKEEHIEEKLSGLRNINRRLKAKEDLTFDKLDKPKLDDSQAYRHLSNSVQKGIKQDQIDISLPKKSGSSEIWLGMVATGKLTYLSPESEFQPSRKDLQALANVMAKDHGKEIETDIPQKTPQGNLGAKEIVDVTHELNLEEQVKPLYVCKNGDVLCIQKLPSSPPQAQARAFLVPHDIIVQNGIDPGKKEFQPIKVGRGKEMGTPVTERKQGMAH